VGDGIVADYLVAGGQDKHLLLLQAAPPLSDQHLDIRQRLAVPVVLSPVAQRQWAEAVDEDGRRFEGDPA
jgi:hypothetical protein